MMSEIKIIVTFCLCMVVFSSCYKNKEDESPIKSNSDLSLELMDYYYFSRNYPLNNSPREVGKICGYHKIPGRVACKGVSIDILDRAYEFSTSGSSAEQVTRFNQIDKLEAKERMVKLKEVMFSDSTRHNPYQLNHPHVDHFILTGEYWSESQQMKRVTWIFYDILDLPDEVVDFSKLFLPDSLWHSSYDDEAYSVPPERH
ncbi:hypothetical protein [Neolewinella agarilytica]|uniref:Uncharacterized protein n=1 Tax=Neolewinella agarilytica TaxID=478744 RepID=A0A1H9M846_9BACT|nr:hypothetical protein [Neolewinella agarilytica]SER19792.1 hypothetical protein SAMN05444359_12765 [Neolewinella agarilytica]